MNVVNANAKVNHIEGVIALDLAQKSNVHWRVLITTPTLFLPSFELVTYATKLQRSQDPCFETIPSKLRKRLRDAAAHLNRVFTNEEFQGTEI
jgi:hypothetical protein